MRRSYAEPTATWATHVMGTIHLLEPLRRLEAAWRCGSPPTVCTGTKSGSTATAKTIPSAAMPPKAAARRRRNWLPHQTPHLRVARTGNVIGCGDWAADRIVPDAMRALGRGEPIGVPNPAATRP